MRTTTTTTKPEERMNELEKGKWIGLDNLLWIEEELFIGVDYLPVGTNFEHASYIYIYIYYYQEEGNVSQTIIRRRTIIILANVVCLLVCFLLPLQMLKGSYLESRPQDKVISYLPRYIQTSNDYIMQIHGEEQRDG